MNKKLVFFGAGGLGREVAWQLGNNADFIGKYEVVGFVDDTPKLKGRVIKGLQVVGNTKWLIDYDSEISVVICIGNSAARKKIYNELRQNTNIDFPTVFAEGVKYSDSVKFGKGCILCLSTILTVDITIGDFFIANLDCKVGHDAEIGDFVTLYPSVNVSGNTRIDDCAEIGTGTNIIQKKTIGKNSIIGAGAVVVRDIPANCTAVGVPAVVKKYHTDK